MASARFADQAERRDAPPAIASLRVLRSGRAAQHQEHRYGSKLPQLWWVLTSRSWIPIPIHYFAIEHRNGLFLFDTGLDPAIASNPRYVNSVIGRFLLKRIFRLEIDDADRLDRVLAREGLDARSVRAAVISHLHFDHIGGIAQIPEAELLVSKREWAQLSAPHPEREWILREHIELPAAKWRPIDFAPSSDPLFEEFEGAHDVAGDGSMVLLPTPGHTPGSVSMLIRNSGWAPILLVADLTYDVSSLDAEVIPGTGDAQLLATSFRKVKLLAEKLPGLVIIAAHDTAAAEAAALATGGLSP